MSWKYEPRGLFQRMNFEIPEYKDKNAAANYLRKCAQRDSDKMQDMLAKGASYMLFALIGLFIYISFK